MEKSIKELNQERLRIVNKIHDSKIKHCNENIAYQLNNQIPFEYRLEIIKEEITLHIDRLVPNYTSFNTNIQAQIIKFIENQIKDNVSFLDIEIDSFFNKLIDKN